MENQKTESGIDLVTWIEDKQSGAAVLQKGAAGNYIYNKAAVSAAIVNGQAVIVEGTPTLANVNRKSLEDFRATQLALIAQADAMLAEMNRLDALVV